MGGVLEVFSKAAVLAFVVACMAAAGLGLAVGDLVAPLCRARLVGLALVANFVVAPAVAYGLTRLVPLDPPIPGLSPDPWPILRPLLFTMLVPLVAGMVVKRYSDRWAGRLRRVFGTAPGSPVRVSTGPRGRIHGSPARRNRTTDWSANRRCG